MTTENYDVCTYTGKTSYPTRDEVTHAVKILKRNKKGCENAGNYMCPRCGNYHISSNKRTSKYKRRHKRRKN